jgi:hypothetical protein
MLRRRCRRLLRRSAIGRARIEFHLGGNGRKGTVYCVLNGGVWGLLEDYVAWVRTKTDRTGTPAACPATELL